MQDRYGTYVAEALDDYRLIFLQLMYVVAKVDSRDFPHIHLTELLSQ